MKLFTQFQLMEQKNSTKKVQQLLYQLMVRVTTMLLRKKLMLQEQNSQ